MSNGGWSEIHPNQAKNVTESILGRIVLIENEHLVIQNYNRSTSFLDGFILIEKKKVKKIKAGNWIRRILTVGGDVIESPKTPDYTSADSITNLIHNLIAQFVKCQIILDDGKSVFGKIRLISNGEIAIDAFSRIESFQEKTFELKTF